MSYILPVLSTLNRAADYSLRTISRYGGRLLLAVSLTGALATTVACTEDLGVYKVSPSVEFETTAKGDVKYKSGEAERAIGIAGKALSKEERRKLEKSIRVYGGVRLPNGMGYLIPVKDKIDAFRIDPNLSVKGDEIEVNIPVGTIHKLNGVGIKVEDVKDDVTRVKVERNKGVLESISDLLFD